MLLPRLVRIGRVSRHALSFVHVLHVRFFFIFFFFSRGFAPSLGHVLGSVLSHLFVPFLSVFFVVFFRRRRTARSLLYHPFFLSTSFVSLDRWHLRRWAWHASWYAHTPHRHTPWATTPRTVGVERSQGGNHPPPPLTLPLSLPQGPRQARCGSNGRGARPKVALACTDGGTPSAQEGRRDGIQPKPRR